MSTSLCNKQPQNLKDVYERHLFQAQKEASWNLVRSGWDSIQSFGQVSLHVSHSGTQAGEIGPAMPQGISGVQECTPLKAPALNWHFCPHSTLYFFPHSRGQRKSWPRSNSGAGSTLYPKKEWSEYLLRSNLIGQMSFSIIFIFSIIYFPNFLN